MKFLGLTPSASAPAPARFTSGAMAMLYGAASFGVVSAAAYSIWAFHWVPGPYAMYASIALVYLGLGGLALSRLVNARGTAGRFTALFALSFLAYAVCWCACWFGLHGRYYADFWGALMGLTAMTVMMRSALGSTANLTRLLVGLLVCHSAGYYLGGELHAALHGVAGKLLWGACHGLGFGAGIGYVLWHCQQPAAKTN
jgi:hypothetical protein